MCDACCALAAVTLARNGKEALDVLEGNDGEHIDFVLTDLLMPEVSTSAQLALWALCWFARTTSLPGQSCSHSLSQDRLRLRDKSCAGQVSGMELITEVSRCGKFQDLPIIGESVPCILFESV